MAQLIQPGMILESAYRGVRKIFEFTNGDGELVPYNCGQAAAATFLTFHGRLESEAAAGEVLRRIEEIHPPDNVGGYFGTSRRRVERICRSHGIRTLSIVGEAKLREHLHRKDPVIVMLGVPGPRLLNRFALPAGHWMVAYGFDDEHVFLTNHGRMTWDEFRRGWNAFVPRLISMRNRGLVALNPA